jgi:tRNA1Val (adenine37-N6)-methyltransferase
LTAAKYLVKPSGRIWFIYHTDRLAEFVSRAGEQKLALLRLRIVHGRSDAPAKIFMAELAKGRKGQTVVMPPLIIYSANGDYTPEAGSILAGQVVKD